MPGVKQDKNRHSRRLTSVVWILLTVAIVGTAVLTERSLSRLATAREVVTHSLVVDKALTDVMTQMLDAETGQRGFLISGQAPYLQPYYTALAQLRESRAALTSALGQEASAKSRLDVLNKAIDARLQELDRTVRLKSEGQADAAVELVLAGTGIKTMDEVREALRGLQADQAARTTRHQADIEWETSNNYRILGFSILINLLLLFGLIQRIRSAATRGHAAQQVMDARNVELSSLLEAAATRHEQVQGLSELSRFLQSCADMDEAAGLLKQHLPALMRATSGALYLMAASQYQLRHAFTWGSGSFIEMFDPGDCWAVRLGQPFRQPAEAGSASCSHLNPDPLGATGNMQCLPLLAHGELMGVLVLDAGVARDEQEKLEVEGTRRFALEQVGLSIGNLKLRESLRQQSIRDVLTGLFNRRFFEESSQREMLRASRLQTQGGYDGLALLMVDIDHFKRFNDLHGHEVGDQVLREVAQVLQTQTRGSDVAARYGGEEFTIVMADITLDLALARAERVRQEVEKLVLHPSGKEVGSVTISIGLAHFPLHGTTVEALLLSSDKALYEAKHGGRNRVVVAS